MPALLRKKAAALQSDALCLNSAPGAIRQFLDPLLAAIPPEDDIGQALQVIRSTGLADKALDILRSLSGGYKVRVRQPDGRVVEMEAKPGQLADAISAFYDKSAAQGIMSDARRMWTAQRDRLLEGVRPGWNEESKQDLVESDRLSAERLIANLVMHDRTEAITQAETWLIKQGASMDPRKWQAYRRLLTEMYRESSGEDRKSTWQSTGGASANMRAQLFLLETGSFDGLLRSPGVFDAQGNITELGGRLLREQLKVAGSGMRAIKEISGAKTAVEAIEALGRDDLFGPDLFRQMTNPGVVRGLREFNSMRRAAGLDNQEGLGVLHKMVDFAGRDNLPGALEYGKQILSFGAVADGPLGRVPGDRQRRHQLAVLAVDAARRDPKVKMASAFAAMAEPFYGREAAWGMADQMLARARTPQQMFVLMSQHMPEGEKLTWDGLRDVMRVPAAQEYFASGRHAEAAVTNAMRPVSAFMGRHSSLLGRYGNRILAEKGSLSSASIAEWLAEQGMDQQRIGAHLRHIDALAGYAGRRLGFADGLDTDTLLGTLATEAQRGRRREFLRRATDEAHTGESLAGVRAASGLQAGQRALANGKGWIGAVGAALLGEGGPEITDVYRPATAAEPGAGAPHKIGAGARSNKPKPAETATSESGAPATPKPATPPQATAAATKPPKNDDPPSQPKPQPRVPGE